MRLIQSVKEKIMKNGLPEGYTRLEYLQSTGEQYIDTGIAPSNITPIAKLKFIPTQRYSSGNYGIFGCFGANNNRFQIFYNSIGIGTYVSKSWQANTAYEVELNGKVPSATINGTVETSGYSNANGFSSYNIYLFTRNSLDIADDGVPLKLYYCKIWDNDTLVRDFIPALDPSDKPCMYDLVSKQPFYNQGTGADFSIGKKLTPVEYLQSTGTQYIDTGIQPTDDYGYRIKNTYTVGAGEQCAIGCMDSGNRFVGIYTSGSANQLSGAWGSFVGFLPAYSWTTGDILDIEVNYKNSRKMIVGGTELKDISDVHITGTISSSIYIGARHYGSTVTKMVGKIYSVEITKGQEVIANCIPVRDENNVGYMLDLLTNTLYANAGTGAFAVGEDDLLIRNISKTKFFKQTTRKVPKGFQEVEYLASDGNQWIDTGYKLIEGTLHTFKGTMMWTASQGNANFFYGYRSVNSAEYHGDMRAFFVYGASPAGRLAIRYGVDTENSTSVAVTLNKIFDITFDGTNLKVDGTTYVTHTQSYTPANYQNMWLFNCNCTGYYSADVNRFIGRIYKWQMYEDGTLVRDFVPYLDNTGRPCMWDMVEGKPYYNQGTEEFSYGRKIIPVEYLESTGTQYIDLGLKGKNGYDFDYKFNSTRIDNTAYGLGGLWETNKSCYLGLIRDTNYFGYHYQNTNAAIQVQPITANTDYRVQAHLYSGEQYYILNGTKSAVGTISGTFTSTNNMRLFSIYSSTPLYCYAKIYYCKIWDNGTLVRDMIPAIDENNIPYMFDKVTHSAFLNQGTGQFSYGDIIKERTETLRAIPIIRHLPLNYLEATGTQYIDTGLLSTADSKVDSTFSFTTMESGAANNCGVFGGRDAQQSTTFTLFKIASGNPQYFRFDYNGQTTVATANQMTWDTTSKYRFEYNGTKYTTTNTTTSQSNTANLNPAITFTTSSICLFAVNTNGTIGQYLSGRIYHYWYTDGTNTIDLYPVLKLPERIPCMYDRISKTYFYNESTDPFLYG